MTGMTKAIGVPVMPNADIKGGQGVGFEALRAK